jgi:hypothetical protein
VSGAGGNSGNSGSNWNVLKWGNSMGCPYYNRENPENRRGYLTVSVPSGNGFLLLSCGGRSVDHKRFETQSASRVRGPSDSPGEHREQEEGSDQSTCKVFKFSRSSQEVVVLHITQLASGCIILLLQQTDSGAKWRLLGG